nr:putative ribonuclease H-like domain-containing protein [Tanacetum cinerariifolium]
MDSLSLHVVSAAKLSILNHNEFNILKIRIEQYFLMTDYSLWEAILNGDSHAPTRVVEGVLQPVAPTTAEQKLARNNELKARGTLLMALPDKHQLKFNSHKDAKTLMEAIKKRFGGNTETTKRNKVDLEEQSIDDLFNSLKIYEAEVKHSSFTCTKTQNLAFVSSSNTDSTTDSVSDAASVSTIYAKMHVSSLPNVDSLCNVVIYSFFAIQSSSPQLDNEDLEQIDSDDLEEMDLKWQMAMKGHFARECRSPKDSRRNGAAEPHRRKEEPANYSLMDFSSSSSSFNNEVLSCSKACSKAYAQLHSQYDKLTADFQSDESWPPSSLYDRFQPSDGYHAVPPPYTGTFMPPKPDMVFNTAPTSVKIDHSAFNVQLSSTKPDQDLSHTNRPTAPIIEDRVSDSEDEYETKAPQIVPSFVQTTEQVKSPRPSVYHVETSILAATSKPTSPKPTSNGKRKNIKACFVCKSLDHLIKDCDYHEKKITKPTAKNHAHRGFAGKIGMETKMPNSRPCFPHHKCINDPKKGNPQHALKDKGVINSGCTWHMTGNMSYLSDFEELNGGYVTFGGNPKGGKISGKGKIKTGKLDFDDVYFVKELKFNLFSVSQMLHIDLFEPTFVKSLNKKSYCLVVTDDYSRFTWVFFLATKDETSPILKTFITGIENQLSLKVKVIRSDNETEFKNNDLNKFCEMKGIKREFSVPRTPQQNGIAERKNKTLIEAARTMLADSLLHIPFWAEAVNTACYVQNRVLVTKPHNKTPYKLLHGRTPSIG